MISLLHLENITKIFVLGIWWNSVAFGHIIASPPSARYFESLSSKWHERQPEDSWRHLEHNERHRGTLEALEPFSKYILDVYYIRKSCLDLINSY